jgi:hypothetical protein
MSSGVMLMAVCHVGGTYTTPSDAKHRKTSSTRHPLVKRR